MDVWLGVAETRPRLAGVLAAVLECAGDDRDAAAPRPL